MPDSKLAAGARLQYGPLAKLSAGVKAGYDLARVGVGLSRGPNQSSKTVATAWANTWPASGATLDLDFANNRGFVRGVGQGGVMDAITFTRASNGTFVGSDGKLQGSGSDKGALGLNLLTFPQNYENTAWTKGASSVVTNAGAAPDGTNTASALIENTTTASHLVFQAPSSVVAGTYTFTAYIKANGRDFASIKIATNATTNNWAAGDFDLVNVTSATAVGAGGNFSGVSASITDVGDGWCKCILTATTSAAFSNVGIQSSNSATPTHGSYGDISIAGSGSNALLLWGAQLELGSTATPYYPTNINAPRFDWASTAMVARANLYTYTELFSNAAWVKSSSPAVTLTDQGNGVWRLQVAAGGFVLHQSLPQALGVNCTVAFDVMSNGAGLDTFRLMLQGSSLSANQAATGAWARYSYTNTNAGSGAAGIIAASTNAAIDVLIRFPQLEIGSSATAYQANGSSIPTNTPLQAATTCNGLLIEESRTNRLLWCRDATQTNWTKTSVTAAKNQTGIDDAANAASSLTASADGGTCIQTITLASGSRTGSVYLKRITGTGNVQVSLDGSTWSTVDLSNGLYNRIVLSGTVTNPVVGIRLATNGDAVAMDYGQIEDGAFATTPILTTTATATRSVDVASLSGSNFYSWFAKGNGTLYAEATTEWFPTQSNNTGAVSIVSFNTSANTGLALYTSNSADIRNYDGANSLLLNATYPSLGKVATGWSTNGSKQLALNGQTVSGPYTKSYDAATAMYIGTNINYTGAWNGWIKRIEFFPKAPTGDWLKVQTQGTT